MQRKPTAGITIEESWGSLNQITPLRVGSNLVEIQSSACILMGPH